MVPLPTSDESEELLRIRHSVSCCCCWAACGGRGGGGTLQWWCVCVFWGGGGCTWWIQQGLLAVPQPASASVCSCWRTKLCVCCQDTNTHTHGPPNHAPPVRPISCRCSVRTSWPWRCSGCTRTRR
jgi:hypothetical protein